MRCLYEEWRVSGGRFSFKPADAVSLLEHHSKNLYIPSNDENKTFHTTQMVRHIKKQDHLNQNRQARGKKQRFVRCINYGGYTVWRAGYAMVCGGFAWAAATFGFFFYDFASRGVPVLEEYVMQRYGDTYKQIKSRVRYSLIPGIW